MKKITLMLLAAASLSGQMQAQTTVIVDAPKTDGSWTSAGGPNGTSGHKYMRASYIVLKSELTDFASFTNSIVTTFGFNLLNGASSTVAGDFTVHLINTTANTYTLGGNWTNIVTTLGTPYYTGNITVPSGTAPTVMDVTLTNPFVYTGDGIYVAFDFEIPGTAATSPAVHLALANLTVGGVRNYDNVSAPTTLTNTAFRPAFRFGTGNTATNEVSVDTVWAEGVVAELMQTPQSIDARVTNRSSVLLNNVDVKLAITGVNPYTATITVPSLAAGASTVVSFTGYNPTNEGVSNIDVTVNNDQKNSNNLQEWAQKLTCNMIGIHPGNMSYATGPNNITFTTAVGLTGAGGGLLLAHHNLPKTVTLTGVELAVGGGAGNVNKQVYGVMVDASGNVVSQTPPFTITQAGTFVTMNFSTPPVLSAGTDYFIGVGQPTNGYFPFAAHEYSLYPVPPYYLSATTGGALSDLGVPYLFGISPILRFDEMVLTATANKTFVCNGGEVTFSVSAAPGVTFTWSPGGSNSQTVTANLTLPGTQTAGVMNYQVVGTHSTGCLTETAVRIVSVSVCTGLNGDPADYTGIKMFPNPAVSGVTALSGLQGQNTIEVVNVIGQTVISTSTSKPNQELDLSALPAGQYFIKVSNNLEQVKVFKLLTQ